MIVMLNLSHATVTKQKAWLGSATRRFIPDFTLSLSSSLLSSILTPTPACRTQNARGWSQIRRCNKH